MLPAGRLHGIRLGQTIPGPVLKRFLDTWSAYVEADIVERALSHLTPEVRQA